MSVSLNLQTIYPEENLPLRSTLYLRGDACGLNWDEGVELEKSGSNEWSINLSCTANVPFEMKVLVDDSTWMIGANHHFMVTSAPSQTDKVFPYFYTYNGNLEIIKNIHSTELNNTRDVIFYTPPSYNENYLKRHSNLLVAHDGQNLFYDATSAYGCWHLDDTLDSLIVSGEMDEIIVAGPYNTPDRIDEFTYSVDPEYGGGKADYYLDFIESTVLPLTTDNYRLDLDHDRLGMMGSSLGGILSCYSGWTRSEVYGKLACMSSSFWWNNEDYMSDILVNRPMPDPKNIVYMDAGTAVGGEASIGVNTIEVRNIYEDDGWVLDDNLFYYCDQGGGHNEASWGARVWIPLSTLFGPETA